jgi:hypothetical protein
MPYRSLICSPRLYASISVFRYSIINAEFPDSYFIVCLHYFAGPKGSADLTTARFTGKSLSKIVLYQFLEVQRKFSVWHMLSDQVINLKPEKEHGFFVGSHGRLGYS